MRVLPDLPADYRIEREIGRGMMGVVYRAVQVRLGRSVAVKVLHASLANDPELSARFEREAKTLAQLSHSNIVKVIDYGVVDESPYIVMDFIQGVSLDSLIASGPVLVEEAVPILRQLAAALEHAHSRGVIHRDVKPANVICQSDGHAFLTDFGIAKSGLTSSLTQFGTAIGTPCYMAPELCDGGHASTASDIYSLGVIAYELILGRRPFDGSPTSVMFHQVHEPPPDPRSLIPDIAPSIRSALLHGLEKDPDKRYPRATVLVSALDSAVAKDGQSLVSRPEATVGGPFNDKALRVIPWRNRKALLVTLLLVCGAIGVIGVLSRLTSPATPAASVAGLSPGLGTVGSQNSPATGSPASDSKVHLGKLGQTTEATEIYARPSIDSQVYYRIKAYEYVVIEPYNDTWFTVLLQNGTRGYIQTSTVARLPYDVTADRRSQSGGMASTSGTPISSGIDDSPARINGGSNPPTGQSGGAGVNNTRWLGLSAQQVVDMGSVAWKRRYAQNAGVSSEADLTRPDNARADDLYADALRERNRIMYERLPKPIGVHIGRIDDQLRILDQASIEIVNDSVGRPVIMQTQTEEAAQAEYDLLCHALSQDSGPRFTDDPQHLREATESLAQAAKAASTTSVPGGRAVEALRKLRSLVNFKDRQEAGIVYRFVVHALQPS